MAENEIRVAVSVERKVNLGNYESGSVFMSLANVPVGATPKEIEAALVTGKITFDVLKDAVNAKAAQIRAEGR